MHDLGFVRANLPFVEEKLRARGADPKVVLGDFLKLDRERRAAITVAEQLRANRKLLTQEFVFLKNSGSNTLAIQLELQANADSLELSELNAASYEEQMRECMQRIPNFTRDEVPPGKSESENELVNVSPKDGPPVFSFPALPHWELGEKLGILDFERAAKISGARFVVYKGAGARLERALINFMLDQHTARLDKNGHHGYTEILPPFMVNSKSLFGTGQLPKFANDLFQCAEMLTEGEMIDAKDPNSEDDEPRTVEVGANSEAQKTLGRFNDHWLIPTAEVPVTNLYRDEVLDEAKLPIRHTAYTPCFRAEAGAYGKDVRGIIRQHQFQKVELVKFTRPEDSDAEHERLTRDAELILETLGLPYRRMLLCAGDTGFSAAKTYDLEVWLPGQGLYREISSCSNFESFQARRANIRYKPAGGKKNEFVHTLNGSGLAVGRTWLAILENYQQADGTVKVPDALKPYMGGLEVIRPEQG